MSRYSFLVAALVGASLTFLPLHPAEAATKKKSSKKSSATTKKKSTTSTAKKSASAAEADGGSGKPALDLPLPAKVTASSEESASAETGSKARTSSVAPAEKAAADAGKTRERAASATVEVEQIVEFKDQPAPVQQLLRDAIDLTRLNLTYTFGSADPEKGDMDCSGTIYHLLRAHGLTDVARDSSGQYLWARKRATFFPVVSKSADSVEFKELQPGDLMFWTGTYQTGRDVPISHVMLYLGREKGTQKRIMFGASDGRSYNGVQRWGVSVFDFKMPKADPANPENSKSDFVGFARIPGLRSPVDSTTEPVTAAEVPKSGAGETAAKTSAKTKAKPAVADASKKKTTARKKQ